MATLLAWTNILSAVVIAGFAAAQWWLMRENERIRRRERSEDQFAKADAAHATVHAEWFRIFTVSKRWDKADLVQLCAVEAFSPADILPRDWGNVTLSLGRLGFLSSRLGSLGFALAYDAATLAENLRTEAESYEQLLAAASNQSEFKGQNLPKLREMEAKVKELATEAANILEDALDHAPGAKVSRQVETNERLHSKYARVIAASLTGTGSLAERVTRATDTVGGNVQRMD